MNLRFRTYLILIFLFLLQILTVAAYALSEEDATESGVRKTTVDETIGTILAEEGAEKYSYREGSLEEAQWMTVIRNWLRSMQSRFKSGGAPIFPAISFGVLISIGIVLGLLILGFFAMRFLGIGFFGKPTQVLLGTENGDFLPGTWGEEGARKAMELASTGMYRNAISVLFKSTLQGLDESGWIRYRKSGGSRRYLLQLRRSEDMYPLFRDMLRRFEIAYYKNDDTFADDWSFIYGKYQDLAKAAVTNNKPSALSRI